MDCKHDFKCCKPEHKDDCKCDKTCLRTEVAEDK